MSTATQSPRLRSPRTSVRRRSVPSVQLAPSLDAYDRLFARNDLIDPDVAPAPGRLERIATVRAEIAAGTYVTPERVDVAVERLLSDLAQMN